MARWIYNRPLDCCNETELAVAKQLARLSDDWLIRWGFYYQGDREGDFLILGPTGGALVLEVKGGPIRKLGMTGRWDGPDKDHPVAQLCAEWSAVLERLQAVSQSRLPPFVAKALCLPEVALSPGSNAYKGIDRQLIVDQSDLADFESAWRRLFAGRLTRVLKESREVFSDAYGQDITPKAIKHFITETDRILLRHATVEFELLDMLRDNRQLLVQGGPGTGKTWLAFEQAYRLAEHDSGRHVLLLCYNLALARTLEAMAAGRKPRCGQITVRSWQTLAEELYQSARLKWREPADYEDKREFFAEEVPAKMREIVCNRKFCPRFDALVVDEAQDHDTSFAGEPDDGNDAGWWSIYFKLLKNGAESPMAAFYDSGQRPLFRDPEAFDVGRLRRLLSQAAHVKLAHALRYSRPVYQFLKSLQSETTAPLVNELRCRGTLPDGPDVELHEATPAAVRDTVREIVTRWIAEGFCRADEILVLSPHSQRSKSALATCDQIGAWRLVEHERKQPGQISFLSVNKAKGLDSLAVLLVDVRPFAQLTDEQDRMDYFMGASRARQLLAVVHLRTQASSPTGGR